MITSFELAYPNNWTLADQERHAYITGNTELARRLGQIEDLEEEVFDLQWREDDENA